MSTTESLLPLFPLGVVLFPKSALPLHIFEERYKILIQHTLETGAEFGINLIDNGVMARVGCAARVRDVLRRYDDGRMDIVVEGERRYEVMEFHDDRAPYVVGSVVYRDQAPEFDPEVLAEAVHLYNKVMAIVYRDGSIRINPGMAAETTAFQMAQKAGLSLSARQQLLEENSETARLRWLLAWFRELLPKLENAAEIGRIVRNDGYL